MLKRTDVMPLNYYKKEAFTGSFLGMRFMFRKKEVSVEGQEKPSVYLEVINWPQPFCFEATDDDKKRAEQFAFNEDGIVDAIAWLNKDYSDRREEFEAADKKNGL